MFHHADIEIWENMQVNKCKVNIYKNLSARCFTSIHNAEETRDSVAYQHQRFCSGKYIFLFFVCFGHSH